MARTIGLIQEPAAETKHLLPFDSNSDIRHRVNQTEIQERNMTIPEQMLYTSGVPLLVLATLATVQWANNHFHRRECATLIIHFSSGRKGEFERLYHHHFVMLPESIKKFHQKGKVHLTIQKRMLWKQMPQNDDGCYCNLHLRLKAWTSTLLMRMFFLSTANYEGWKRNAINTRMIGQTSAHRRLVYLMNDKCGE